MTISTVVTAGVMVGLCVGIGGREFRAAAAGSRLAPAQSYVIVFGSDGRAVFGLSGEDFSLKDGGARQPVIDASPATAPLAVVVVVAGMAPAPVDREVDDLVRGVDAMTSRFSGSGAAGTASETGIPAQVHVLTEVSAGARLELWPATPAARRSLIAAVASPRRPLAEQLAAAARLLESAATDRRAIVVLGPALSNRSVTAADGEDAVDAISAARASLWTLELPAAAGNPDARTDRLLNDLTRLGGGLRFPVATPAALSPTMGRVAELLASQYVVTYGWPDPMLAQLSIATRHDRGTVLMPVWMR